MKGYRYNLQVRFILLLTFRSLSMLNYEFIEPTYRIFGIAHAYCIVPLNFMVKGVSFKDQMGRMTRHIKMILSRMIHHSIKVLYCTSNLCVSQVLSLVTEMSAKTCGLAGS